MNQTKIHSIDDLAKITADLKAAGKVVVHCHGVFDLLHVGHIKHFEAAKKLGGVLVVTVTPDRFVNKGPHRPAFPDKLRAEAIASLACVDFVAINEWPTAVETINLLKPNIYVKGSDYKEREKDVTGKIYDEEKAVEAVGGRLVVTEEETFSASSLINRYMDVFTPEAKDFLSAFREKHTPDEVIGHMRAIRDLKILAVGETIIDEYQFCNVMGKSGKEPVLAARHLYTEKYAGGILAIANHISNFCQHVGLLSMLGDIDSQDEFVNSRLQDNVRAEFVREKGSPTIVKRRFLEEYLATKLFEVYVIQNEELGVEDEGAFCEKLEQMLPEYEVVVVADYGHGLMTERALSILSEKAKFLAVNTQTNAGNRGFNMISKYPRANFISVAEPEIRLETRDSRSDMKDLVETVARRVPCDRILVTRGKEGCLVLDASAGFCEIPAFSIKLVDRVGAGDAVLALTAPCAALGIPADVLGFIANVVGAEACAIMGNKSAIEPTSLFRHITSLMK